MQQHIAACGDVLRRGALDLVVADAVQARDKDHCGGRQLGHVDRVVPGTADHRHVAIAQLGGEGFHLIGPVCRGR